ncbi:MAG TPA: hypothetical protein VKS21_01650, partial [Spirochaetota bacterium]|nr:hypothetical protein [Spirochaetota bacterium]
LLYPQKDSRKKLLDELLFKRRQKLAKQQNKPRFFKETRIRPRGAGIKGRYLLFEKRLYHKIFKLYFIVYDNKNKSRTFYKVRSYEDRKDYLQNIISELRQKTDYKADAVTKVKTVDNSFFITASQLRYHYLFLKKKNCYNLMIYRNIDNDRVVLLNYSLVGNFLDTPQIVTAYDYFNGGSGVKLGYRKYLDNNKIEYVEDVICFNEKVQLKNTYAYVRIKEGFKIDRQQGENRFLTDIFIAYNGNKLFNKNYFINGTWELTDNR